MRMFGSMKTLGALAVAALLCGGVAEGANYPLEITNIRPAGSGGMASHARIYQAYPGLVYNIRAAVIGGAYPYTYSLTNAPSGMTINAQTGEINWPSPAGSVTPTLVVRDSEGTQRQQSWTINTSTAAFKFVDAVNGRNSSSNGCSSGCGTGAIDSPWRTLSDVYRSPSSANTVVYFKSGTYTIGDLPRDDVGGAWDRVDFEGDRTSCQWVAYPGQRPVIDYQNGGPFIRLSATSVYIDGFETVNSRVMAFQHPSGNPGPTFRRNNFHHHNNARVDLNGTNAAMIMTTRGDTTGTVIQDNDFHHSPEDAIKVYMQRKLLIENNLFRDGAKGIELKDSIEQFTVRGNRFYNLTTMAIGGNMARDSYATRGEILFNYVQSSSVALDVNQNGIAAAIQIYRNTFVGRTQVRYTDASGGPFTFQNNVIVNNDSGTPAGSHILHVDVSAPQRVVLINNLVGSPSNNIVDANGALTAAYASYRPTHGHGTVSATPPPGGGTPPPPAPAAPTAPSNVRIISN
jgi:hypothetical protein